MAAKGSTAPAITSPLLAWPAKPTPRSTPLVTPVTGTCDSFDLPSRNMSRDTLGSSSSTSGKGKEKADDYEYKEVERNYRPPQKPLSPRQLGRIAQSFGIEVPSLPTPPLSSNSSPPRSSSAASSRQPTRSSPFLLTVIPPISLQPPSASTSTTGAETARRWRRGRLIPLQPTMGSMLLAIAREYGLPSTKGINLYISNNQRLSTSSSSDVSDEPGPRISQATWTSLFTTQAANLSVSRTSTPDGSPRRTGQLFNRDPHPSSPLSPWSEMLPHPRPAFSTSSTRSTPIRTAFADQAIPLTPSSLHSQAISPSPVIATIEFEIDPDEATWFHDFNTSGRRRKLSTATEGGVRELHLVSKYSDSRPRFLRDMEANALSDASSSTIGDGSSMVKTADESQASEDFTEPSSSPDREDDLLAPFELRKGLRDEIDKRGSALVMKEQLDDLEIMMRQLSPKEIRLTSPREMTPRMAAKVATLQFPPALPPRTRNLNNPPPLPPRANNRPAKSPLVNSFTDPELDVSSSQVPVPSRTAWPAVPYAKHSESPGSPHLDEYFRPPARPSLDVAGPRKNSFSEETRKRMEAEQADSKPMTTEWKPRRPVRPPSPNISSQVHARTPSYSLSPELVSTLKSPSVGAPRSPEEERKPKARSNSISLKGLRASMSKAGNRASKKDEHEPMPAHGGMDRFSSDKSGERETYGLFKQPIDNTSSFPGLESRPSMSSALSPSISEFGAVDLHSPMPDTEPVQATGSLPAKQPSGMRRLFGGSLPFKNRSSSDNHTHTLAQSSAQRTSLKSRRNPSHDGANLTISPPIPESFHKMDNGFSNPSTRQGSHGEPDGISMTSPPRRQPQPGSPSSPRNVKRKPVPGAADVEMMLDSQTYQGISPAEAAAGLTGSASFGSVASFVLEDPPKRRTRGHGEYR